MTTERTFQGIDCSGAVTAADIECLRSDGINFIARYYLGKQGAPVGRTVLTGGEAQAISKAGLSIVTIFDNGFTTAGAFSAFTAAGDSQAAIQQAQSAGQPSGTPIYFTVSFDCAQAYLVELGPVFDYFNTLDDQMENAGYTAAVYGSGLTCLSLLTSDDAVPYTWLAAESLGWSGYNRFHNWSIKQGDAQSLCNLSVNNDIARGDFGSFTVPVGGSPG